MRIKENLINNMETVSDPVSAYPVANVDKLPPDLQEKILKIQEKTGFVPNVFLALGHRPKELRAFFSYYEAVVSENLTLQKTEIEMIVVATSSENKCPYCVVAHGAILRIYSKNPTLSDQLAINYNKSSISEKHRLMLSFACKLARSPELITAVDKQILTDIGFSDQQIWDIGAVTSFFALSNRMAHLINLRPNREFYDLARRSD